MGGVGNLLAQNAMDLGQLLHQRLLRLQPPGRIDDAHVCVGLQGAGDGPVGHTGRITVCLAGHQVGPQPLGPDGELLDRRGAKGVGRAENGLLSFRPKHLRQLGD